MTTGGKKKHCKQFQKQEEENDLDDLGLMIF